MRGPGRNRSRRRRYAWAGVVVFVALLALSAQPVSAANSTLVSHHETASELSNGSLTNADVERSGEAGFVGHNTYRSTAVSRWAFDEGSGSAAHDHVGSNDGAITGASWTTGVTGQALSFDGTDDQVKVPNDPSLNPTDGLTVSTWIKLDGEAGTRGIVSKNNWRQYRIHMQANITKANFRVTDGSGNNSLETLNSGIKINDGEWHHVALTVDPSGMAFLLVDGQIAASTETPYDQLGTSIEPLYVANGSESEHFPGTVDDLRVYSEALTPGQIQRLHRYHDSKLSATATERWALDAGQGETAFGDEGDDMSITNGTWVDGPAGQAISFDGDGSMATGNYGASNFSISFRLYLPENQSDRFVVNKFRSVATDGWGIRAGGGRIGIYDDIDDVDEYRYRTSISTGEWHYVTAVISGTENKLYLDGELVGSGEHSSSPITSFTGDLVAGERGGDEFHMNGSIDDLRVYNRELTASDHEWLFNHPGAQLPETSSYQATHDVTHSVEGVSDLTLRNATADVTWEGSTDDGFSWTTLASTTVSSSQNLTQSWSEFSGDQVRISVDVEQTDPDHTARLHDEGAIVRNEDPIVDDTSLEPNTTDTIDEDPVTLSADVSDRDFGTVRGEQLNVSFYVDGDYQASDILGGNGTASVSLSAVETDEHDWHVEVSDSWGGSDRGPETGTATFVLPSDLTIYNESDPMDKLTNVEVRVRFYGEDDLVVERTTTNGEIDMSGLPADQSFIVVAEAEGYHNRRIHVDSLVQQQEVYLLLDDPNNVTTVYNRFELEDLTGQFPIESTRLVVERALNTTASNGIEWVTIGGDYFGADNSYAINLEQGVRYRLKLLRDDGTVRVVGPYQALDEDNPKTIRVGEIRFSAQENQTFLSTSEIVEENGNRKLIITYSDPAQETRDYYVRVHEAGNYSNYIHEDEVFELGNYSAEVDLPNGDTRWVVNWTAVRSGEEIGQIERPGSISVVDDFPLGEPWSGIFSFLFVLTTITLSGVVQATRGAIATCMVAGLLTGMGLVEIYPGFWVIAMTIAIGGHLRVSGGYR